MSHTRPEMAAERGICLRILRMVRDDPCRFCKHRVEGWNRAACMACRTYPECMDRLTGPRFELDPATVPEMEKAA